MPTCIQHTCPVCGRDVMHQASTLLTEKVVTWEDLILPPKRTLISQ